MSVDVIVLAAGKGTRMNTDRAKVLHEAAGRSLLGWALASLSDVEPSAVAVVVGHQADAVSAACPEGVTPVVQDPQLDPVKVMLNGTVHMGEVRKSAESVPTPPAPPSTAKPATPSARGETKAPVPT